MDQKLYHGSKTAELKELKPFESTQKGSYVYATPYEEVAVIFGFSPGSLLLGIGMEKTENGKNIFTICERKANVLKQCAKIPISVYEVDPVKFEQFTEHNWANIEVRASGSQSIIKETVIEDVSLKLKELEQLGKIKRYH
ncbi:MAG: hypothetical protein PHS45_04180 [Bacilli bacterium]|nr:hypothetical protein [Bacilli bacterium]